MYSLEAGEVGDRATTLPYDTAFTFFYQNQMRQAITMFDEHLQHNPNDKLALNLRAQAVAQMSSSASSTAL
jgi:Tfp pilus assembly protein PilF